MKAEGAKGRNTVKLTNSDPELLVYFMRFLRQHFAVPDERVKFALNLFADHVEQREQIERYWLTRLASLRSSLRASTVNTLKYSQNKRVNKLRYGTASLIVHNTQIVQTIYGSIQEYGGFERPDWLD